MAGLEHLPLEGLDAFVHVVEDREVRVHGPVDEVVVEDLRALPQFVLGGLDDRVPERVNELFVAFTTSVRHERIRRFGILPGSRAVAEKEMTMVGLEQALAALPDIGAPDYSDEGMLQYLRTERIVPPYQTRGYKLVELVRIYEVGAARRS